MTQAALLMDPTLFAGPDLRAGPESHDEHLARLGHLPTAPAEIIETLERSDLRGRGGAAFPVGVKWRSVAAARGRRTILANGAEGEPLSRKDRLLMEKRPHLVLDGALLAAAAVNAKEIFLYIGAEHRGAITSIHRAILERTARDRHRIRLVSAPVRYVSGEETAAVHFINDGVALPLAVPPRPFEKGIADGPTLVQNVESLALVALIVRRGDHWFRSLGRGPASGSNLITVTDNRSRTTVVEAAQGTTVGEMMVATGAGSSPPRPILLGGYFGGWVPADEVAGLVLDSVALKAQGRSLGCGVVASLPEGRCGVVETSGILAYLARESARQCGPCVFGLRAIAAAIHRLSTGTAATEDLGNIQRWAGQLAGRGACRHPDGAAGLLGSALRVFRDEFLVHGRQRRCTVSPRPR